MVTVGLSLICALVAWTAAAALTVRLYQRPRLSNGIWLVAGLAIMVALSAGVPAAMLDFSNTTFRLFHVGLALLGPLWLTWGLVEFTLSSARAHFAARQIVAVLTVVPLAVMLLDPLSGGFEASYPPAGDHYQLPAVAAVTLVDLACVAGLLACCWAVVQRMRSGWELYPGRLPVVLLMAGAVLVLLVVSRFGLGVVGQFAMLAALACLWQGSGAAMLLQPATEIDEDDAPDGEFDDPEDPDESDGEPHQHREGALRRRSQHPEGFEGAAPRRRATAPKSTIVIYTVHESHVQTFDAHMNQLVAAVARYEPGALLFVCHTVDSSPAQRILYAMYSDQRAYEQHEHQPHVMEFARNTAGSIAATNLIPLSPGRGHSNEALIAALTLG